MEMEVANRRKGKELIYPWQAVEKAEVEGPWVYMEETMKEEKMEGLETDVVEDLRNRIKRVEGQDEFR